MADKITYAKLPSDPCLTQEQMMAYIDGKLSASDQHACEKHIVDCAMCEDALEGLSLVKDRDVLATPLKTETLSPSEGKVIPLSTGGTNKRLWYAAAAVLLVVFSSVFMLKQMDNPDGASMAENKQMDSASTEYSLAPEPKKEVLEKNDATITDANNTPGGSNAKIPAQGPVIAWDIPAEGANDESPRAETNEDFRDDLSLFDGVGDKEADDYVVTEETPAPQVDLDNLKEEEVVEEADKKEKFWDRTKVVLEQSGGVTGNRSEKKQDSKDAYRDGDDQPNGDTAVANKPKASPKGNADMVVPAAPQETITMASGNAGNNQNPADSVAPGASQINLELSYQNGVNLLNSGQANAAITLFDQVLQDKNHPRYEDAEFQKANALIKVNRTTEAKTLLQSIEAKKGKHAAEATELLKTL